MNTLLDTSSLYAIVVQMAPDTPVSSERGNGEDMVPPPELKVKGVRPRKTHSQTDEVAEKPLPAAASPPPSQAATAQPAAAKARLDFSKARVKGLQPTQVLSQSTRIPVIMRPDPAKFFCVQPLYGGYSAPTYLWRRKGSGRGVSDTLRMVTAEMAAAIEENGGDILVAGVYWCRYHKGGDFLLVVSLESDNEYVTTTRDIVEKGRNEWVKRINKGGYYDSKPPLIPIPPTVWEDKCYEDVLALGFQEIIEEESHPDFVELVHSRADAATETDLSPMGERMAKVERMAASMGIHVVKDAS